MRSWFIPAKPEPVSFVDEDWWPMIEAATVTHRQPVQLQLPLAQPTRSRRGMHTLLGRGGRRLRS